MKSKKEEGLKLLRKERVVVARVWNILCIDCDREKKTAFFGRPATARDALHLFKSSMPHCLSVGSLHCLFAALTAKP